MTGNYGLEDKSDHIGLSQEYHWSTSFLSHYPNLSHRTGARVLLLLLRHAHDAQGECSVYSGPLPGAFDLRRTGLKVWAMEY